MSVVSADTLQLSHVMEATPGVTPSNPVFKLWRTTGESLVFAPQTSESDELGGSGRFQKPATVTGTSINGDISFRLAKFPALEEAIAGVLAATWGECPLTGAAGGGIDSANRITVGNKLKTFTIEKRFPNPSTVAGAIPTATAGVAGNQTATITLAGVAAVGTGMVVMDLKTSTGIDRHMTVDIVVGDDDTAVATKVETELKKIANLTVSRVGAVVTVDAGAGETVTMLSARAGNDQFYYQRFKGASFSALALSVSPNNPITGSVTIVGGSPELDVLPLAGATYTPAGSNPVFVAPKVMNLDIGQAMGVGTHCWTSLNINLDSQNRGIACIGSQGDREVVLGTLTASVSGDVYFSDQAILQALLDNKTIGDSVITFADANNDIYRWDFYGMKPTSGQLAAGGAGQDLTIPVTLQPTPRVVCSDSAGNNWESGLILSLLNTPPTLPAPPAPPAAAPITISPAVIATNTSVVTISGGPADKAYTATFTYAIDGGTDANFVVNIAAGDTVAQVIGKVDTAAQAAGTNDLATSALTATGLTIGMGAGKTSLDKLTVAIV
jgi:hypothetical protein